MQTLKEIMNDKINKDRIYDSIVKKDNNYFKLLWLVPISLILIISMIMLSSNNKLKSVNNSKMIVNEISEIYTDNEDAFKSKIIDFKDIEVNKLIKFSDGVNYNRSSLLINWDIPKDLDNKVVKEYYLYNKLYKYRISYNNNKRIINIEISMDSSDKRNYYDSLNSTSMFIKNNEIKIFKNNNNYIVFLIVNDYYIDIDSYNILDSELESLLNSMVG